jgi:hypothetical protein
MRERTPAFQRSLFPARSLLPERFRGPVAPSATDANPFSPAPGGWDSGTLAESGRGFKEGFWRDGRCRVEVFAVVSISTMIGP